MNGRYKTADRWFLFNSTSNELLTKDLCKTTLQNPNSDKKVSKFVMGRFPELNPKQETERQKAGMKVKR
jgi:hypothetical protein